MRNLTQFELESVCSIQTCYLVAISPKQQARSVRMSATLVMNLDCVRCIEFEGKTLHFASAGNYTGTETPQCNAGGRATVT